MDSSTGGFHISSPLHGKWARPAAEEPGGGCRNPSGQGAWWPVEDWVCGHGFRKSLADQTDKTRLYEIRMGEQARERRKRT